nr:MAG TPA: hypothetical protein [Caudoviricetes sp.]
MKRAGKPAFFVCGQKKIADRIDIDALSRL